MLSSASLGPLPGGAMMTALSSPLAWMMKLPSLRNQSAKQLHVPEDMLPEFRADMQSMNGTLFRRINEAIHSARVDTPIAYDGRVLVVCGEKEAGFIHNNQRKIMQHLPNATGQVIPAVGHAWCFEDPALFADVVRKWFMEQPLPEQLLAL